MEVFGVGGFSFYLGYSLLTFYWLFTDFPPELPGFSRGLVQMFAFAGLPIGYLGFHLLRKRLSVLPSFRFASVVNLVLTLLLPTVIFITRFGIELPFIVYALCSLLSGIGASYFVLRWLEGCGSARIHEYLRFTSAGIVGGAILFFLVSLITPLVQPLFSIFYILVSFFFMGFLRSRKEQEGDFAIKPRKDFLPFVKEIEPSLFVFGIVFGLSFSLLFIQGPTVVLFGMVGVLIGACCALLLDLAGITLGITLTQRGLLVIATAACLTIPFSEGGILTVILCVVVAAWSFFNGVNYAMLVKRSVNQKTPVFFSVASGLSVSTFGFVAGWILSLIYAHFDFSQMFMTTTMLILAVVLVTTVMTFFPISEHHDESVPVGQKREAVHVAQNELNEKALFRMRCEQVVKLYGLSPRESDVLLFLAKGRNANYIQKELIISPHTAKSHIYSIYRKLEIHSQQKLMDFIEEYPIEITNPPGTPLS
jgi:DNA-binding CsgD family transcriptional regulator